MKISNVNFLAGLVVFLLVFQSCSSGGNSEVREKARQAIAAQTTPEKPKLPEKPEEKKPEGPTTTMKFEKDKFDFGTIDAGEVVNHVFKFKNTGEHPLIISNAKAGCGCTVPNWPKEPIPPGESGEISVKYDSKNKKGRESKKVTITANTEPSHLSFLTIEGNVNPKEGAPTATQPAANPGALKPKVTTQ